MHARRIASAGLLLTVLALAVLPAIVTAHSELETSDPADGATLTASPTEITGDFSEAVDPARSTMELRGPDGAKIATGGVPADGPATRMTITGPSVLSPGAYEVRWTTVTADDDGVERGTFTFTIAATSPTPGPATSAPAAPSATSTPTPAPTAASPAPTPTSGTGAGDLLIPILVLGAVLLGGAALFLRRRR